MQGEPAPVPTAVYVALALFQPLLSAGKNRLKFLCEVVLYKLLIVFTFREKSTKNKTKLEIRNEQPINKTTA